MLQVKQLRIPTTRLFYDQKHHDDTYRRREKHFSPQASKNNINQLTYIRRKTHIYD